MVSLLCVWISCIPGILVCCCRVNKFVFVYTCFHCGVHGVEVFDTEVSDVAPEVHP